MRPSIQRSLVSSLPLVLAAAVALSACGEPDDPDAAEAGARLVIDGDAAVRLAPSHMASLRVRYLDGAGEALDGEVAFALVGEPAGARLTREVLTVDGHGAAEVVLRVGDLAAFEVVARAPGAEPVKWTIAVDASAGPDPVGAYVVTSRFDLATAAPGAVGVALGELVDLTDGPLDPASYVLDRMFAAADAAGAPWAAALASLRPGLDAALLTIMRAAAPDALVRLAEAVDALVAASRALEIESRLVVEDDISGWSAEHVGAAITLEVLGERRRFPAAELDWKDAPATLAVERRGDRLVLAEHRVAVPYGALLANALDAVIAPALVPTATSLETLLEQALDCARIEQGLADLGWESEGFAADCERAVDAVADAISDGLVALDTAAPVALVVAGDALAGDPDHDGVVDALGQGAWRGRIDYAGELVALPDGARFSAVRP
jgi:hypothetical protein